LSRNFHTIRLAGIAVCAILALLFLAYPPVSTPPTLPPGVFPGGVIPSRHIGLVDYLAVLLMLSFLIALMPSRPETKTK
jgi:uncharacterized RDD family membrane protein YckC